MLKQYYGAGTWGYLARPRPIYSLILVSPGPYFESRSRCLVSSKAKYLSRVFGTDEVMYFTSDFYHFGCGTTASPIAACMGVT